MFEVVAMVTTGRSQACAASRTRDFAGVNGALQLLTGCLISSKELGERQKLEVWSVKWMNNFAGAFLEVARAPSLLGPLPIIVQDPTSTFTDDHLASHW
jgi:hypothetical protein